MRRERTLRLASALAATAALLSLAGLVVLNTGLGLGVPPLGFGFSEAYDAVGYRLLAGAPSKVDLDRAAEAARKAQALSPYANAPRLRIAYIDSLQHGRLGAAGAAAFARSYDLVPVDPDVAAWRIRFGLEHWQALPADARQAVYTEAKRFYQVPSVDVRSVLTSIDNPDGRLAAAFWLIGWEYQPPGPPNNPAAR